jgi:hypothetical protein
MERTLDDLPGHWGYAAALLPDATLTRPAPGLYLGAITGFVGACSCARPLAFEGAELEYDTWYAEHYHPPTVAGEQQSLRDWEHRHAGPLLATPTDRPPTTGPGTGGALFAELDDLLAELDELTRTHPVETLARLRRLELDVDALLTRAVRSARAGELSWAQIGRHLGITRQSAHQRFTKPA